MHDDPGMRFRFEADGLSPGAIEVARLRGEEAIARAFRIEVELVSTDPALDLGALLGAPAALRIEGGAAPRVIRGVITEAEQGAEASPGRYRYRAVLAGEPRGDAGFAALRFTLAQRGPRVSAFGSRLRLDPGAPGGRRLTFAGEVEGVAPAAGQRLRLEGHFRPDFNVTYLVTDVAYEGEAGACRASFTAVAAGAPAADAPAVAARAAADELRPLEEQRHLLPITPDTHDDAGFNDTWMRIVVPHTPPSCGASQPYTYLRLGEAAVGAPSASPDVERESICGGLYMNLYEQGNQASGDPDAWGLAGVFDYTDRNRTVITRGNKEEVVYGKHRLSISGSGMNLFDAAPIYYLYYRKDGSISGLDTWRKTEKMHVAADVYSFGDTESFFGGFKFDGMGGLSSSVYVGGKVDVSAAVSLSAKLGFDVALGAETKYEDVHGTSITVADDHDFKARKRIVLRVKSAPGEKALGRTFLTGLGALCVGGVGAGLGYGIGVGVAERLEEDGASDDEERRGRNVKLEGKAARTVGLAAGAYLGALAFATVAAIRAKRSSPSAGDPQIVLEQDRIKLLCDESSIVLKKDRIEIQSAQIILQENLGSRIKVGADTIEMRANRKLDVTTPVIDAHSNLDVEGRVDAHGQMIAPQPARNPGRVFVRVYNESGEMVRPDLEE